MTEEQKKRSVSVQTNINSFLLYSLGGAAALGFDDLISSIFASFHFRNIYISKIIYFIVMFSLTIGVAYYMGTVLQS